MVKRKAIIAVKNTKNATVAHDNTLFNVILQNIIYNRLRGEYRNRTDLRCLAKASCVPSAFPYGATSSSCYCTRLELATNVVAKSEFVPLCYPYTIRPRMGVSGLEPEPSNNQLDRITNFNSTRYQR